MSPRSISELEFQQRETELITLARKLAEEHCLTTLTIDKLVAESRYSKGTIYKHFLGKEDLLMAICNTCVNEIQEIFAQALKFKGNSRERIIAVMVSYVIWSKLHPSQLFMVLSAHSPSVSACCSDSRNDTHAERESCLMAMMNKEIEKAVNAGDLSLSEYMTLDQVTFALWSASWGAMALIMSKGDSVKLGPMVLERESYTNTKLILDGFGWKPLSNDWDYSQSIKNIVNELFKPEIETLEQMGNPFVFV
ncbi:MAG: TetR/AcrR family transcriptional regulator [Kangiellaceae bacterium]|nr:TetR/AcrR family transcriptional regulator [Kangiellaceae bacterium]